MPGLTVAFSDFVAGSKVHRLSGKKDILNDAVKNTYFLADMIKGNMARKIVQGGQKVKDDIKLNNTGTFRFYNPHPTFTINDEDTTTTIVADWRFAMTHYAWSEEAIELNEGDVFEQYFDLKYSKEQDAKTDYWNGAENALWAKPTTQMEDGTGEDPPFHSIPFYVNENTTDYHWPGTGFQKVLTVDPATESGWRPQVITYDTANIYSVQNGVLRSMRRMLRQVRFESPDSSSHYFENDRLRSMKICTNDDGITVYEDVLTLGNDSFRTGPSDPAYGNPVLSGIPLKWVSTLDTANLELTKSGSTFTAAGTPWVTGRPRYLFLNFQFLYMIWHKDRFLQPKGPFNGGILQPVSWAMYFKSTQHLWCRSRARQGIVAPAA